MIHRLLSCHGVWWLLSPMSPSEPPHDGFNQQLQATPSHLSGAVDFIDTLVTSFLNVSSYIHHTSPLTGLNYVSLPHHCPLSFKNSNQTIPLLCLKSPHSYRANRTDPISWFSWKPFCSVVPKTLSAPSPDAPLLCSHDEDTPDSHSLPEAPWHSPECSFQSASAVEPPQLLQFSSINYLSPALGSRYPVNVPQLDFSVGGSVSSTVDFSSAVAMPHLSISSWIGQFLAQGHTNQGWLNPCYILSPFHLTPLRKTSFLHRLLWFYCKIVREIGYGQNNNNIAWARGLKENTKFPRAFLASWRSEAPGVLLWLSGSF